MYKAISEGLINLADHFFEMEYLDAQHGLDIYKESIVANDRLQVRRGPQLRSWLLDLILREHQGQLAQCICRTIMAALHRHA